jgi:biotin carboxyl carrier protein
MAISPTSRQRVEVIVNGKPYLVEVGDLTASPITISVNGRPYLVSIETTEVQAAPGDKPLVGPEPAARQMPAPEKAPVRTGPTSDRPDVVRAPMPGNILDIAVKPGDQVSVRQQLCSLEAMKMKNAIRSPRDGVIGSVEVAEGQAVAHGDALFSLE